MPNQNTVFDAHNFAKIIEKRNKIETIVGLILIPIFCYAVYAYTDPLNKFFHFLIVIGLIFTIFYLNRNGQFQLYKDDSSACEKDHYKSELRKQIDLLSSARYWYVFPISVGLIGDSLYTLYSNVLKNEYHFKDVLLPILMLIIFAGVIYLNEVIGVKKLQKDLEKLG